MAKLSNPEPLSQEILRTLEEIRSSENLRALTEEESGSGIDRLPAGVYGFTYSPAVGAFPLFRDRDLRSFEGHKLPDGNVVLLGFLTGADKQALDHGKAIVHLFPEPQGDADQLVRIPLSRIVRHVEHSQRTSKGLELEIAAES